MGSLLGIRRNNAATKQIHFWLIRLTTSFGVGRNKKYYYHYRPLRHSYKSFFIYSGCGCGGEGWSLLADEDAGHNTGSVCVCVGVGVGVSECVSAQLYCWSSPGEAIQKARSSSLWFMPHRQSSLLLHCWRTQKQNSNSPPFFFKCQVGSVCRLLPLTWSVLGVRSGGWGGCSGAKFIFSFHAHREVNSVLSCLLWSQRKV